MKKIYTMISALALTAMSFSAYAAESAPTSVVPANNSTVTNFDSYIALTWGDNQVAIDTSSDYFSDEDYPEGIVVEMLVNGQPFDPWGFGAFNATALAAAQDEDGWWIPVENGDYSEAIIITTNGLFLQDNAVVTFTLPSGTIFIGEGTGNTNSEVNLTYNYVSFNDDQETDPKRGSKLFNLSEVTLSWVENVKISGFNELCNEEIKYGLYAWYEGGFTGETYPATATINENGTATISLGSTVPEGDIAILIPEGFFELTSGNVTFPNPSQFYLQYTIEPVATYPEQFQPISFPFSTFGVYSETSVTLAGQLSNIIVMDNMEGETYEVGSYKAVNIDGYPGIEFTLAEPYYGSDLSVTIPAGTLNVNGSVYENVISMTFYTSAPESITPANNSLITELGRVALSFGSTEVEINENATSYPMIKLPDGSSVNIKDYVEVVVETIENPYFPGMGFDEDYYSLVVDFGADAYTNLGDYEISFPADYFTVGDDVSNNAFTLNYTLVASLDTPNALYQPDSMYPSYFVYWDTTITAMADLEGVLTVPGEMDGYTIPVTLRITSFDPTAENEPANNPGSGSSLTDNALVLSMGEIIEEFGPGSYSLSFGSIVKDAEGAINKPFDGMFFVAPEPTVSDVEPEIVVDPNSITVSWDDMDLTEYNPYNEDIIIIGVTNPDEEYRISLENGAEIVNDNTLVIDLDALDLADDNEYDLIIGENFFYLGEGLESNAAVTYTFTYESSAVNTIGDALLNNAPVYNLQGVKVGNGVEGLNKGIYIINGKKVLIRK